MHDLSIMAFERIARKVGIKRVSRSALIELRDLTEEKAREICHKAVDISEHAHRNTVLAQDVDFVTKK
ncbi:histone [archaeon]|nr:histone [archaeon]